MGRRLLLTLILIVSSLGIVWGQQEDSTKVRMGFSAGSSVEVWGRRSAAYTWVAPQLQYRASGNLTISGGFAAVGSLLPADGYALQGRGVHSLAPRKQGTHAGALWTQVNYRANDRLWMWASVATAVGQVQPLWLDVAEPLGLLAVDAGAGYRLPNGSLMELHLHFVRDQYGTAPWYGGDVGGIIYGHGMGVY